jgi:hypothetical protein
LIVYWNYNIGDLVHRKRISADELVWIFHERMRESAGSERPVTLAIVPDAKVGWRVILTKFTQNHRPETVADIRKWERALRKQYALLAD